MKQIQLLDTDNIRKEVVREDPVVTPPRHLKLVSGDDGSACHSRLPLWFVVPPLPLLLPLLFTGRVISYMQSKEDNTKVKIKINYKKFCRRWGSNPRPSWDKWWNWKRRDENQRIHIVNEFKPCDWVHGLFGEYLFYLTYLKLILRVLWSHCCYIPNFPFYDIKYLN